MTFLSESYRRRRELRRPPLLRIGIVKHGLLAVAVGLAFGCSSFAAQPPAVMEPSIYNKLEPEPVKYDVLLSGQYFPRGMCSSQIIRTQESLDGIYRLIRGGSVKAPVLDFDRYAVALACAGSFPTGGYSMGVLGLRKEEKTGETQIVFAVKGPPPDAIVTMAFTHPYMLVVFELDPKAQAFVRIEGASSSRCPRGSLLQDK